MPTGDGDDPVDGAMIAESVEVKIARLEVESLTLLARLDQIEQLNCELQVRAQRAEWWLSKLVGILEKMYKP